MSTTLGALSAGSIVKITENGSLVEFYIGEQNYESGLNGSGRTLLVRNALLPVQSWNSAGTNTYKTSSINTWLCGTYLNQYEDAVKTAIGSTKFYYTPGDDDIAVSTMTAPVFLLSATELGETVATYSNTEGSTISAASTILIGKRDGVAIDYWTRTPSKYNYEYSFIITAAGYCYQRYCTNTYGIRPAFTLPSTLTVDDNNIVLFTEEKKNAAPVITSTKCVNGETLEDQYSSFKFDYTVTDSDKDVMTVTEKVDSATKVRPNVNSGTTFTIESLNSDEEYLKLGFGTHLISIYANDGTDISTFNCSFEKPSGAVGFELAEPLSVDGDITSGILSISGNIPEDAEIMAYVSNNAKDDDSAITIQDVSAEVKSGSRFYFDNKTAENGFAFIFAIAIQRGSSGIGGYVTGITGSFQ